VIRHGSPQIDGNDLQQTSLAGFNAHLVKPVAAERLKEAIDRVGTA